MDLLKSLWSPGGDKHGLKKLEKQCTKSIELQNEYVELPKVIPFLVKLRTFLYPPHVHNHYPTLLLETV